MKRRLVNFLIWLLYKLDPMHMEKCSVSTSVIADFINYIPDDHKWHYCGLTIDYWIKIGEGLMERDKIWMDGVRVSTIVREITDGQDGNVVPLNDVKGEF